MKLLTMKVDGRLHIGMKLEKGVVDLTAAGAQSTDAPDLGDMTSSMRSLIGSMERSLPSIRQRAETLEKEGGLERYLVDEEQIEWGPCIPEPGKIICVGLNYRKHAEETNSPIPESPILFNKFSNTITAHQSTVAIPPVAEKVDYEAELAIVIGRKAASVSREEALDYVFGYCNANDLSARDLQLRTSQWLLGKTCDDFCPIGPYLVTSDEVGNPNMLDIACYVNGELRQHSNTSDMIYHCDEIISYVSRHMTLEPGDVILTGTPEGVVMGYPPEKQMYLKAGDTVEIEIEKLGTLRNIMA
ncbi:fumarylacetoacetate hydrolase family protein [Paenibacillus dakarensis]|uniref:fumarylacetoacetate hydrolase family protein n=1 Tax=Paenibacillus dakarensis TaxID=1527293 RepID=UPI0006D52D4D|nr:fumarylacetoacetate hydrolase family protein [Paenibacillus dakarensis]